MQIALFSAILAGTFTIYPGKNNNYAQVEAITDRGPILEMIIRCPSGSAIITYSKIEHLYCRPNLQCDRDMASVVRRTCR